MKPTSLLPALALLALAGSSRATDLLTFTDKASFLAATGAADATGPLPDLGYVPDPTLVGSLTFSIPFGGDDLFIGTAATTAGPDWTPLHEGNDIAQGWEALQVDAGSPIYSIGLDFVQPDATMPSYGGTPIDSVFEITLYDGATQVGQVQFRGIPVDVLTFLGVWSPVPFTHMTMYDVTDSPFVDDDEFYGEFYTGTTPAPIAVITPWTDKAGFLSGTGAISASGPIPNLGETGSAKLGSVNIGLAAGGDNIAFGTFNTGIDDWTDLLPGHDIAMGWENMEVVMDAPVLSFGFDFVQPDATMPPFGGTPLDSIFELSLYLDETLVGTTVFSSIPADVATFLGVSSSMAFNRVTIIDVTTDPLVDPAVDDDEFWGEFYTGPGPHAWNNLGSNLGGVFGDPLLFGTGPLAEGSDGWLVLVNAPGSKPATLFISLAGTPSPFKGGTLWPVPVMITLPLVTSPIGEIPLGWPAWPAGLSGFSLYFQYGISDPAAVKGVALSNCLRADVP